MFVLFMFVLFDFCLFKFVFPYSCLFFCLFMFVFFLPFLENYIQEIIYLDPSKFHLSLPIYMFDYCFCFYVCLFQFMFVCLFHSFMFV